MGEQWRRSDVGGNIRGSGDNALHGEAAAASTSSSLLERTAADLERARSTQPFGRKLRAPEAALGLDERSSERFRGTYRDDLTSGLPFEVPPVPPWMYKHEVRAPRGSSNRSRGVWLLRWEWRTCSRGSVPFFFIVQESRVFDGVHDRRLTFSRNTLYRSRWRNNRMNNIHARLDRSAGSEMCFAQLRRKSIHFTREAKDSLYLERGCSRWWHKISNGTHLLKCHASDIII